MLTSQFVMLLDLFPCTGMYQTWIVFIRDGSDGKVKGKPDHFINFKKRSGREPKMLLHRLFWTLTLYTLYCKSINTLWWNHCRRKQNNVKNSLVILFEFIRYDCTLSEMLVYWRQKQCKLSRDATQTKPYRNRVELFHDHNCVNT